MVLQKYKIADVKFDLLCTTFRLFLYEYNVIIIVSNHYNFKIIISHISFKLITIDLLFLVHKFKELKTYLLIILRNINI